MLIHPTTECLCPTDRDRDALRTIFTGLSDRSRFLRFHTGVSRYPDSWWERLARVEPGSSDVALAWVGATPVGHGQWHDVGDGTAELALAVVDTWHRRGVATALLDHLASTARCAGLERFMCWIHPENSGVRRMLLGRGARPDASSAADSGAWVLDLDVADTRAASSRREEAA